MHIRTNTARRLIVAGGLAAFAVTLFPTSEAATPWVMLARRAIGRVEQLRQPQIGEQAGFDVATVILNADATRVYATAVRLLRTNTLVHITAEDATAHTVQFSNGQRSAGITVTDLGTRLSQLLVASTALPGQDSATMRVVDGILRVCEEMNVMCSVR